MWMILAGLLSPAAMGQSSVEGLEQALAGVQEQFPEEIASDALYRAALGGVVDHLGKQLGVSDNRVLSPEEYTQIEAWMDGERHGIGAEFSIVPGRGMALSTVFSQSPAALAGLKAGDLLISIDNHPFIGLPAPVIQARVQRQKTPSLVFDVRRDNGTVSRVEVERGSYQIPSVSARRDQDALVIRILFFGSGAASQVQAALQDWSGAAIVLDLRDNPGGSLDEMVAIADLFLDPEAVIVQTAHGGETGYTMHGTEPALWTGGVMILVNRGTSEVAEALAAALQDHGRARVVGTRSAGQGIRSSFYPAGRGLMLKIADTRMTSPSGRSWHSQGLTPDIFVQSQQLTLPALGRSAPPDIQRDAAVRLISTQESDR
jgi:carboxyl-terminal processing protease